ncbi:hypothetical protein DIPPA_32353 [Diplonema papillatum]|nr:hypothetical protein DIPPA_28840 [Diplonema papillatum]KAJ9465882.1 hypothetical protein DIPPA_32353 [Diplonema papillatum]
MRATRAVGTWVSFEEVVRVLAPPAGGRQRHGLRGGAAEPIPQLFANDPRITGVGPAAPAQEMFGELTEAQVRAALFTAAFTHGTWSDEYRRVSHMLYLLVATHRYQPLLDAKRKASPGFDRLAAKLSDHHQLPAFAEAAEFFAELGMALPRGGWGAAARVAAADKTARRSALFSDKIVALSHPGMVLDPVCLGLEDLFHLLDAFDYKTFTPLHYWCEAHGFCQVLTQEFVEDLAAQLAAGGTRVVEFGAGSGRLAYFLKKAGVDVSATDADPRGFIASYNPRPWDDGLVVTELDVSEPSDSVKACLERCDVALVSWMPEGKDWTSVFRHYRVPAYCLVGEPDAGQSGQPWNTFGFAGKLSLELPPWMSGLGEGVRPDPDKDIAPYAKDGYTKRTTGTRWAIGQRDLPPDKPSTTCTFFEAASA